MAMAITAASLARPNTRASPCGLPLLSNQLLDVYRPIQGFLKARRISTTHAPCRRLQAMHHVVLSLKSEEQMVSPFNVLITGSTKGIGYAFAREFLQSGDNVVICSRSEDRVQRVVNDLQKEFGKQTILGKVCDVKDSKSVNELVKYVKQQLGYVDIWINNAGSNAYTYKSLVDTTDDAILEIVQTNMIGVMLCCREAIRLMKGQPRGGHIFNMDGAGADGRPTPRFAAYGATKRSLQQFTKTLQAELGMQGVKNVIVHNLSPGMVTTDLLMSGSDTKQAKFFINILAEPPEVVARYLVPKIRSVALDANTRSTYFRFLTNFKAYSRIIARLLLSTRKNRFINEDEELNAME